MCSTPLAPPVVPEAEPAEGRLPAHREDVTGLAAGWNTTPGGRDGQRRGGHRCDSRSAPPRLSRARRRVSYTAPAPVHFRNSHGSGCRAQEGDLHLGGAMGLCPPLAPRPRARHQSRRAQCQPGPIALQGDSPKVAVLGTSAGGPLSLLFPSVASSRHRPHARLVRGMHARACAGAGGDRRQSWPIPNTRRTLNSKLETQTLVEHKKPLIKKLLA